MLWAVITQPRPTVRSVMVAVGLKSPSTAHKHLVALRRAGLVEPSDGKSGNLRSTWTVAAIDRSLLPSDGPTPKQSTTPAG